MFMQREYETYKEKYLRKELEELAKKHRYQIWDLTKKEYRKQYKELCK